MILEFVTFEDIVYPKTIVKSRGPSTLPCGTPKHRSTHIEVCLSTLTTCVRSDVSSGVHCHVCPSCKVGRVIDGGRHYQRRRSGQAAPKSQSSDHRVTQLRRFEYERGRFPNYAQGGTHSGRRQMYHS